MVFGKSLDFGKMNRGPETFTLGNITYLLETIYSDGRTKHKVLLTEGGLKSAIQAVKSHIQSYYPGSPITYKVYTSSPLWIEQNTNMIES